jgi:putative ABC transport system substrate-binding protein
MKRREFITLVGGGVAATWPLAARAQQPATPVVGVFGIPSLVSVTGLRNGLSQQGFVERQNVIIDIRTVPGTNFDQLLAVASDLVNRPVAVLIAGGSARGAQAAKAATTTIPIVFANGSDPVKVGLVASMNRPGGNATGVSFYTSALGPKRLELLRELVPQLTKIAFLVNPTNPVTEGDTKDMEDAARSVGQRIIVVSASTANEIDVAFATIARDRVDALIVNVDAFFSGRRQQLAALAARYRIPASYNNSEYVEDGGLMSYGDDRMDSYRQVGVYTGRILKGDKPADLPVLQPTKFQLVINLKTAKALGLDVPPMLLARADEVIE